MPARFINIDRQTPMLMPCDLRDWLPDDHIVHFIIDAVSALNLLQFKVNERGSGSEQYPPSLLLALLIYCYLTGRFASRKIEQASYHDVAVRYLCANLHPDHDTICKFRRENHALFSECFVKVLAMAREMDCLKKIGGISVDGTKIKANASKHAAVSYKRAGEIIEELGVEVETLMQKAEDADSTPLKDGLSLPDEITRRTERIAKLETARKLINERFQQERKKKQAEYERKMAERKRREEQTGRKLRGAKPKPPPDKPSDKAQCNFTDPDSRIMKAGNGAHFEQAFNAQAAVDTEGSYMVLGQRVTANPNDKKELLANVESVDPAVREVSHASADTGFFSEKQIEGVEADSGPTVYCAVAKKGHRVTVKDLEKTDDPPPPPEDASTKEKMRHRLQTREGKAVYRLRKQTVEPVFGVIKHAMGFRQFHLRGHPKVQTEWTLVTLAYNMKRLFNILSVSGRQQILP